MGRPRQNDDRITILAVAKRAGVSPMTVSNVTNGTGRPIRTQVIETVRAAFGPYVHGDEVHFDAACWMVGARAPFLSAATKELADD